MSSLDQISSQSQRYSNEYKGRLAAFELFLSPVPLFRILIVLGFNFPFFSFL